MKFIEIRMSDNNLYVIENKKTGVELGYIDYYPQWKQYVFSQAIGNAIWSIECLQDIIDFMKKLKK